jgi:hypothetical protein
MAETLKVGGAGKDGELTVAADDGTTTVRAGMDRTNSRVTRSALSVGGVKYEGYVEILTAEGKRSALLGNASVSLGGRGSRSGQLSLNTSDGDNTVVINAGGNDGPDVFLGAANRPARIQLTTGGNPGPTINVDGRKNAVLFQKAGSNTDNIVEINGTGSIRVGGHGRSGAISVRAGQKTDSIIDLSGDGTVRVGGAGVNGTVSVRGADGKPLAELLAFPNEGVLGLGQANRPGRISLYGAKGESIRIDAKSGDVMLFNADCAEEFDVRDGAEPGMVMVLTDDGDLTPSTDPYDTRVAGVVSGAGSFKPAFLLDRRDTGKRRAPIALMGKVFCHVDADVAPVRVGDLLTTAEHPGHAMRITDQARAFGAVLGKALAPLRSGRGLVPVLVALQ